MLKETEIIGTGEESGKFNGYIVLTLGIYELRITFHDETSTNYS
jgi:hypothetical protein